MKLGFIGLGNIGKPMAKQWLKHGGGLTVFDMNPAAMDELAGLGATAVRTAGEVAGCSELIGLCVRDDQDVEALLDGCDGLLAHAATDSIIAVHSTVRRDSILRWASRAAEHGVHLIDAPITGGAGGAAAGTLVYMAGGSPAIVDRCRAAFCAAGTLVHAGPLGAGIALKLCNNLMTYAAFAAIDEAAALAARGGLELQQLIEVGRANGVVTPQMETFIVNRNKLAATGDSALRAAFAPFAALGRKDLAAAIASAEALDLPLPLTEKVTELIEQVFLIPAAQRQREGTKCMAH